MTAAGCSRNPNVEIVGSYFPGWMVSVVIAIALTGAAHVILRRRGLIHSIGHPALIYPSMVVLFTCLLWLCFFA
jgi:uncharacterized membrane protein YraQ (UPF0718 family)